jgi:predicted class III extradiol MEMO1 family dioxygenase
MDELYSVFILSKNHTGLGPDIRIYKCQEVEADSWF